MADSPPIPIAAAARHLGLPERSLYRAVEKRRVPSTRSSEGVALVRLEDAATWKAERAGRCGQGTSPGAATSAEPVQPHPPAADVTMTTTAAAPAAVRQATGVIGGDLAAAAVEAFDHGISVTEFCRRQRIDPDLAMAAWRKYREMGDAAGAGERDSRLAELESEVKQLRRDLELLTDTQDGFASGLHALTSRVNAIPLARSELSACQACGARWLHGQPAPCPECGEHAVTGTFSPAPRT